MVQTKQWIVIRKFAYLKRPVYKWTCHNDVGGVFSNSGEYRSFNTCANYARANYGNDVSINTYIINGDLSETFSPEMSNCSQIALVEEEK